jgi:hypothetical protein
MVYKVQSRKSNRLKLAIIALAVVAIAGVLYLAQRPDSKPKSVAKQPAQTIRPANTVDNSPATSTDNKATEDRKSSSDTPDTTPSTNPNLAVTILNASVIESSGTKYVHVGNQVDGATSGSCTLTATKSGESSVTSSSTVRLDANTYTCGVFNVPASKFSSGSWNLTLKVTSGGSSASDSYTVLI